jgi:hypothetical protein
MENALHQMENDAMSLTWGFPSTKILASEAFDGRLEKIGIRELSCPEKQLNKEDA